MNRKLRPHAQLPPGLELTAFRLTPPPGLGLATCEHAMPSQRRISVRPAAAAVPQPDAVPLPSLTPQGPGRLKRSGPGDDAEDSILACGCAPLCATPSTAHVP